MGQKLVNEFFKTLADGQLMWDRIIRPDHKRHDQRPPVQAGQKKYSEKQTAALRYFACKPKDEKKNQGEDKSKGKEIEQPAIELNQIARKPDSNPSATPSSSSAVSKSTRRRPRRD
ncbi:hypothetical protein KVR01_001595 [Diaporthe batatas]|uniref:uncharacterized protein n=1 Tax=Diaporthe batatas TaxID=748121 RepID=UPI001D038862|nr:uncharacterized protein KVR01_001595 [Diaporthe batatas]KAG8168846.1 hypothetical protein KVR01_001595 [Diaporthe batatas]